MKRKSKNAFAKKKKEFRYHKIEVITKSGSKKNIWHPSYVFLEKGNVYIYVSITHSNKVKETIVIKMKRNPNPLDKRDSYWVAEIKYDTKDRFRRRRDGWSIDESDDQKIREMYKKR